jgi:lipopolysaccharide export system protein LptC
MHLNFKNLFVMFFLTAAAGASWYWSRAGTADNRPGGPRDTSPLGYYLTDAEIVSANEDGHLLYKIWAGRAEERPNENRLYLRDVRVEYRPIEDIPWLLTADSGEAPSDQSHIDLYGNVKLANEPRDQGERTLIQTQELRFEPETYIASTKAAVRLFVGARQLDAVGIRVYLRDDRLELESNVHGEFDP